MLLWFAIFILLRKWWYQLPTKKTRGDEEAPNCLTKVVIQNSARSLMNNVLSMYAATSATKAIHRVKVRQLIAPKKKRLPYLREATTPLTQNVQQQESPFLRQSI